MRKATEVERKETDMIDKIPTVKALVSYPQLAILDALERTLELASSALLAAYDEDGVSPSDEEFVEEAYAEAIVNQMTALQVTLLRYRRTVEGL